jgi:hypothetical protein
MRQAPLDTGSGACRIWGRRQKVLHPKQTAMNITAANTKADIIDAAMEITDYQQAKINQLQQRQVILFGLVALLSIINLLG